MIGGDSPHPGDPRLVDRQPLLGHGRLRPGDDLGLPRPDHGRQAGPPARLRPHDEGAARADRARRPGRDRRPRLRDPRRPLAEARRRRGDRPVRARPATASRSGSGSSPPTWRCCSASASTSAGRSAPGSGARRTGRPSPSTSSACSTPSAPAATPARRSSSLGRRQRRPDRAASSSTGSAPPAAATNAAAAPARPGRVASGHGLKDRLRGRDLAGPRERRSHPVLAEGTHRMRRLEEEKPRLRRAAAPPRASRADHRAERGDQGLPGRPHGARPGLPGDRPRRVRLPRRPDRLRQVDADQDADPRARRHRRLGQDRRPGHRQAAGEEDPAAAPQHRHRLPGLQAPPRPHRLRQRRLRAAGDRRQPRRNPRAGAADAAPGRALDQDPQLPRPALRRRAAARLRRPRLRQPPAAAAGRRAERKPRPGHLDRDHAAALPDQQGRDHRRRRHPRPRDGGQHAAPRGRALRGPRRPRRGLRRLHRGVDDRIRPADAGRDGRRRRGRAARPTATPTTTT